MVEQNWYHVMGEYLRQLTELRTEWDTPIICAGDLLHRWNQPPEFINWCLEHLPEMYAIPGNHDLPYHSYQDIHKSAFWTLVKTQRLILLEPDQPKALFMEVAGCDHLLLHAFPYGSEVKPIHEQFTNDTNRFFHLAVVHSFIWMKEYGYPDAPQDKRVGAYAKVLKTYNAAVFGDNHKGFLTKVGDTYVLNHGTFMRRRADEITYRPSVGLLWASGKLTRHYLDTSVDKFVDVEALAKVEGSTVNLDKLLEELMELGDKSLDYLDAVRRFLDDNKVRKSVRDFLLLTLERRLQ